MSHFARADELNCQASAEQVAVFEAARQGLAAEVSLRNSPAVPGWPQIPSDWVRPGSTVELWGKNILASDMAMAAGTIPYQIFCNLRRVPKLYCEA